MGSVGKLTTALPRYSNERGYIEDSTVKTDERYSQLVKVFTAKQEQEAADVLRVVMQMEERGELEGEYRIEGFYSTENRPFGKTVNEFAKAFKTAGYPVYERVNADRRYISYSNIRGVSDRKETAKARVLKFRKK